MLTKKEANRLRGLILHYVDAAVEEAFAGAQDPEDAEQNARATFWRKVGAAYLLGALALVILVVLS